MPQQPAGGWGRPQWPKKKAENRDKELLELINPNEVVESENEHATPRTTPRADSPDETLTLTEKDYEHIEGWLNEMPTSLQHIPGDEQPVDTIDCNMVEAEDEELSSLISSTCPARWESAVTSQGNPTYTFEQSLPTTIEVDVRSGFSNVPFIQSILVDTIRRGISMYLQDNQDRLSRMQPSEVIYGVERTLDIPMGSLHTHLYLLHRLIYEEATSFTATSTLPHVKTTAPLVLESESEDSDGRR